MSAVLKLINTYLGIGQDWHILPENTLDTALSSDTTRTLREIINERSHAKTAKDWTLADALRDEAQLYGYLMRDINEGVRFTYTPTQI